MIDPLALPAGQMVALLLLRGSDSGSLIAMLRASVAVEQATPSHEDYFLLVAHRLAIVNGRTPSLTPTGAIAAEHLARALAQHAGPSRFILARTPRRQ